MARHAFTTALLLMLGVLTASADRFSSLMAARNLALTTTSGTTYYYIISIDESPMMVLQGTQIVLCGDTFAISEVASMRFKTISSRFVLDEDSLTFGANYAVDNGMLALRRTLQVGKWNSVMLPVGLTGRQVRDAFGADAMLAKVKGVSSTDNATIELTTIPLNTNRQVMEPNQYYLLRPTREADVPEGKTVNSTFGSIRPTGPFYVIPNVSMALKQVAGYTIYRSPDRTTRVTTNGTYTARNGSTLRNPKVAPGIYWLDEQGFMSQQADSVAMKAFSAWFENTSATPVPLRFYIDGVGEDLTSGIAPLLTGGPNGAAGTPRRDPSAYDLQGRRLAADGQRAVSEGRLPKGIYVINGKKVIIK